MTPSSEHFKEKIGPLGSLKATKNTNNTHDIGMICVWYWVRFLSTKNNWQIEIIQRIDFHQGFGMFRKKMDALTQYSNCAKNWRDKKGEQLSGRYGGGEITLLVVCSMSPYFIIKYFFNTICSPPLNTYRRPFYPSTQDDKNIFLIWVTRKI